MCHDLAVPTALVALFWLWLAFALGVYVYRLWRRITQGPKSVREARAAGLETPDAAPTPPPAAPPVATSVPPVADPEPAGRTGLFAAAPPPDALADDGAERPTVAEALQGVSMPCGLAPVPRPDEGLLGQYRVAFVTDGADAATVGAAVADELERLGYAVSSTSATEAVARRGAVVVRVTIYPRPGDAQRGDLPLFPAAPEGSVGVEFST